MTKRIHFIGIGGIGNSSLAQILHHRGDQISGSDSTTSEITKSLKLSGIKITIGHKASNISKKHQLVVYSPAIPPSNPELKKAKELGINCQSYPEALGELTKEYYTIAITGTHGKSTTTAMTALIAEAAKLDPTVAIGTKIEQFNNKNYRAGKSNYLIIEACEYKRSFLNFEPNILIITNVEAEHLDYYKNLSDYKKAFVEFANKVPGDGTIIINSDDKNSKSVVKESKAQIISWSNSDKKADFILKNNELSRKDGLKVKIRPGVSGKFNLKNAASAAIGGILLNIEKHKIEKALKSFKGSWRRMQYKKIKLGKCKFIDDYAHHPTEIQATLSAIREENPDAKILSVFQPHQYSRTKLLLKEFGESFIEINEVIIPNIYKVRDTEEDVKSISTDDLVKEINKHDKKAKNGHGLEKTAEYIKKNHHKYDIIVTMGAGDINEIYKMF